jgi:hypothetical protein
LDALVDYKSDLATTNLLFAILEPPTNGVLSGLNPMTGEVNYTPVSNYAGPDAFRFTTAIDSILSTGLVEITVSPVNDAPQFIATPDDVVIQEMAPWSVTNAATDVDLPTQSLSYTLIGAPTNAAIDPNGVITWAPLHSQGASTNTFTTVVSDGLLSATNGFLVTVVEPVAAPVILSLERVGASNVVLTWSSQENVTYEIRYRTDLSGGDWAVLQSDVPATNTTASVVDTPGHDPQRFYQVIVKGAVR